MALNKQKKIKGWCPDQSEVQLGTKGLVRCPTCNKRLAPRIFMKDSVCPGTSTGKHDFERGQCNGCGREKLNETARMQLPPHKEK